MVQIPPNPLVLIDGSSYLYRAYHAFPPLTNKAGEPTGAIYGVINMIRSLILQYQPTHAAVIFDAKGKTFRDELFEHYKSHRPLMPDDLCVQIEPLHAMVKAMGLPLIVISGVEADDVIGVLAHQAEKKGRPVIISTGDKDMAQLVTPGITLVNTMTNTILGPEEVAMKYGVPPELIPDFLALMGDASDNIPGVPGVGEKTAKVLLQAFGGLDALYAKTEKIAGLIFRGAKTMAAKLEKHKKMAYLSSQLATIKTDLELGLTYEELSMYELAVDELLNLFKKYEFKRWTADVEAGRWLQAKKAKFNVKLEETFLMDEQNERKEVVLSSPKNYEILLEESKLVAWIEKLKTSSLFAFNVKTDSLDTFSANLIGLSFSSKLGVAVYVPVAHDYLGAPNQISRNRVLELLKPLLEDDKTLKVGKNLKFDHAILRNYGIALRGIVFDIMLESYVLDSVAGCHDIDSLSVRWLNHKIITFKEIAGKSKNQLMFNQITLEDAGRYAAEDIHLVLQLHLKMWPKIQRNEGLLNVFKYIEMPLVPVLSRIEHNGVKIDPVVLHKHSEEISLRLTDLERKAYDIVGEPFNLSSSKQLQRILFDRQGIKPIKKTPGGMPSTSEEVLEELALDYPLPKVILEYRSLAKLKSTYTDKLPRMINPQTGRVHTSYHQAVTATGRLSSTHPNLQNIPARNKEGRRIRQAFISTEGYLLVSADYSQIELRIMAHLSRDKDLLEALSKGKDIHRVTAAEVFGLPIDRVTNEQRQSAKAVNFGLIYGMSAFGLAHQLNISRKESQQYIDLYFERYPGVREYMERACSQAKKKGYVETLNGRRLYLPDIKSRNVIRRAAAERSAINAPLQGTAADIIKCAMVSIDDWLQKEQPRVRMIMQVHDELVFEVHKEDVEVVSQTIHQIMESSVTMDVSLPVEIGSGENWDEAH